MADLHLDPFPPDPLDPHDPYPNPDATRFPNTRRRLSTSRSGPSRTHPEHSSSDPDTCRICRGDGSPEEPLFYPCRCSGSIKYVHQDCLMEWLSHSQKKHCELCKTPFRFTKLYDPNMPKALPPGIFVSHMAKYLLRNLLFWLRAALVVSVWLGWLPYLMRSVWTFMFWISDEGLMSRSGGSAASGELDFLMHGTTVCPSSPLFAETTSVATIGGVIDSLPPESAKLVRSLYGINLTSSDPIYATILRLLFGPVAEKPAAVSNATLGGLQLNATSHQSLLSEVAFLRNLTRHPTINRAAISVLEGLIITVLVIVCFILIILVRDYVVQQQPEINMRAAFAAVENPPPAVEAEPEEAEEADDEEGEFEDIDEAEAFDGESEAEDDHSQVEAADSNPAEPGWAAASALDTLPLHTPPSGSIQDSDRSTVHEYLAIYREAGGDPEKILNIARERHLDVRLDYWMRITRSMMDRRREDSEAGPSNAIRNDMEPHADEFTARGGDEQGESSTPSGKRKATFAEVAQEEGMATHADAAALRPRANTDGPQITTGINPLANNSWSFSNLPPAPPSDPQPEAATTATLPAEPPAEGSANGVSSPSHPAAAFSVPVAAEPETIPPETPQADPQPPEGHPRPEPEGLVERVADFMWRELDNIDPSELEGVRLLHDPNEEPAGADGNRENGANQRDREAAEGALDAEAVEDAEDLEGILELLGMRGPIAGLFQNAIFCAFLVCITIFLGIFIPYNIGRVMIWLIANPKSPARFLFSLSKFVQDCCLFALGFVSSTVAEAMHALSRAFMLPAADYTVTMAGASWAMAAGAADRIASSIWTEFPVVSTSDVRNFSATSHEALLSVKGVVALPFLWLWRWLGDSPAEARSVANSSTIAWEALKNLSTALANPGAWVLDLSLPERATPIDPALAYWGGMDRFWAVLAGYATFAVVSLLYLRRGTLFSTTPAAQEIEASIIDALNQASGVMKVILIITIEMLLFPLYCGVLLDLALLPLFEGASLRSRILFAVHSPLTSLFVHWFIGTAYMFHFALFVSMCRKIMRKGVLYFIRDPDDPEFHPVRDVLERTVVSQLRKIMFSAVVYGTLVIMCLGGVVWGLSCSFAGVFPIRYKSNEPVLEFPLDVVFYNVVVPMVVLYFRPSNVLHSVYTWWFRRCARALRLTWFLFGERRIDEEGRLVLAPDSPDQALPFWRKWFLTWAPGRVVAKGWREILEGGTGRARPAFNNPKALMPLYHAKKQSLVRSGQLVPDGRFVRAPASDQVKIPKGKSVFLEVSEQNERLDGLPDRLDTDIYSTRQYQLVYVPPHFRARIFFFILFIWLFAAVTGVSITVVPLAFGRWLLGQLMPPHVRINDVYAFTLGVHVLGLTAYALFHAAPAYRAVREAVASVSQRGGFQRAFKGAVRAARVVYAYFFILGVFPLLYSSLVELYALVPLHELMHSALLSAEGRKLIASGAATANALHKVRVMQAWTTGLFYLKVSVRAATSILDGSRLTNAAKAVMRRGWFDPDVVMLTRAFVLPGLAIWLAAVTAPLLLARVTVASGLADGLIHLLADQTPALHDAYIVLIYRMSFPFLALGIVAVVGLWSLVGVFRSWQMRIRDEAYLIGERLHNFAGSTTASRARRGWSAGGARL
ncbi:hypothetical protein VTI74DRAFT_5985 [Chaetomium olivicolor]